MFEAVHEGRVRFAIRELSEVRIVRYDPEGRLGARMLGLSAVGAALLTIRIVGPVSRLAAGLAVVVFLVGGLLEFHGRERVRWELMAQRWGRPVMLFRSADRTEFEQVCRGLQRALERQRDAR